MKCFNCYAKNGNEERCLIGEKPRMLVCGHYGCDLQERTVEKRMGIEKSKTNLDLLRTATEDKLIEWYCRGRPCGLCPYGQNIECGIRDWLRQEAE